jgi:hypothetical protein
MPQMATLQHMATPQHGYKRVKKNEAIFTRRRSKVPVPRRCLVTKTRQQAWQLFGADDEVFKPIGVI